MSIHCSEEGFKERFKEEKIAIFGADAVLTDYEVMALTNFIDYLDSQLLVEGRRETPPRHFRHPLHPPWPLTRRANLCLIPLIAQRTTLRSFDIHS